MPPLSNSEQMKLTYFNDNKGRNELTRLIFAVGGVPYEDDLIGAKEYMERRDNSKALPWGQVPTLSVPGEHGHEVFGQSCSIARFAAKKSKLYPSCDIEALRTDAIVDSWRDTLDLFYETVFARTIVGGRLQMVPHPPSQRYGKLAAFLATELTAQFARYDDMLQPTGQICRESEASFPGWADLAIFDLVKTMETALSKAQYSELMKGKIALVALVKKIDALEEIQAHLEKNPYKDMSSFFVRKSYLLLPLEMVLMPMLYTFLGMYNRVKAIKPKTPT